MQLAWNIALIFCAILFIAFTFVIAFGAPFLPTLKARVPEALDLAGLKAGDTLLELGSGDGRVLLAAAKRGINSVGYELNPLLVLYSWLLTLRYRNRVKIVWGNYWNRQWPPSQGIFVFLLQPYMEKLDKKLVQQYEYSGMVVSFAFTIPGKKPIREKNGLYLYKYSK